MAWVWSRPRRAVLGAAGIAAGAVFAITIATSAAEDRWWRDYAGGPDSSRYFDSKTINRSNVGALAVAWTYPHGETLFNPIVVHGTIYARARNGSLVALEARTGREIWIHEGLQGMSARGMNYWESKDGKDRRLLFTMNDYLQAIDAATGRSITTFGSNGVVDLREGLGRDPATIGRIQSGTPGKIFENLIMLGSATGEGYMSPPGDLRAYDVVTGKLVWQFHTIPRPGEFGYETWPPDAWKYVGGANVWGEITVDARARHRLLPHRLADLRLLRRRSHRRQPVRQLPAGARRAHRQAALALPDRPSRPLGLRQQRRAAADDASATTARTSTSWRMAGKTGFLYVFDRVTGAPIWPIEERPVPKSDVPGEQSWPTQPFPTKPPAFSRQTFTADDINPHPIVTDAQRDALRKRMAGARNTGLFTPIDFVDAVHVPGSNGGALFGFTASDPNGSVYVIGQNDPAVLKLLPPAQPGNVPPGAAVYQRDCQACHAPDRSGTPTGPTLLTLPGRLDAAAIRSTIVSGKGRMPAFPHINDVEMDALVTFLSAPPQGGGGGRGRGARPAPTFPPGPVVASGGAQARPQGGGGRGRGPRTYPEGVEQRPQYVIDAYGLVGTLAKPPFTTLTKYDLNTGTIAWQIGLGDHPRLAAMGITGTGTPQMRSSMVVTAGGLVFAPGGDGKVRAYDSETGKEVWVAALGGAIRGAPSMYEIDGRQYLLVASSGDIADSGAKPGTAAASGLPTGYVAFALPQK